MAMKTTSCESSREPDERRQRLASFRAAAREAWDDYQRTGLHLTAAEADVWMARLESGQHAEAPDCHL